VCWDVVKCLGCGKVQLETDLQSYHVRYISEPIDEAGLGYVPTTIDSSEEFCFCDCGCVDLVLVLSGEFNRKSIYNLEWPLDA